MLHNKRALQIAIGIASLVPLSAGLAGIVLGPDMVGADTTNIGLDSHYRYLSGLLMGIGIGFWATIPNIEYKTPYVRLLAGIVVLGGFARLYSLLTIGVPDHGMVFGLGMELVVTPLLAFWQYRLARSI